MKNYKMYEMILDDGQNIIKVVCPALSVKDLKKQYSGNGEFVRIKEVTENYPLSITNIMISLREAGYGEIEREAIARIIRDEYENTIE